MPTLLPRTSRNRFSLLTISVFITATGFWSMWQFFTKNDSELTFLQIYSVWIAALLTTLIVFLAASLIKITLLLRSHKNLLFDNDERQQREEALRESEARYRIVAESA